MGWRKNDYLIEKRFPSGIIRTFWKYVSVMVVSIVNVLNIT